MFMQIARLPILEKHSHKKRKDYDLSVSYDYDKNWFDPWLTVDSVSMTNAENHCGIDFKKTCLFGETTKQSRSNFEPWKFLRAGTWP